MNIEHSPNPMTWSDAINYAISKGKVLPNAETERHMIINGLIPKGFIAWSSNTSVSNIFNAQFTNGEIVNNLGKPKYELLNFYMIDEKDQLKGNQRASYINGDI